MSSRTKPSKSSHSVYRTWMLEYRSLNPKHSPWSAVLTKNAAGEYRPFGKIAWYTLDEGMIALLNEVHAHSDRVAMVVSEFRLRHINDGDVIGEACVMWECMCSRSICDFYRELSAGSRAGFPRDRCG